MDCGLFYHLVDRGPGKLIKNLISGLAKINVTVIHNEIGDLNGSINKANLSFPKKTLMGPNLFVLPTDNQQLIETYENFVVPSLWVKKLYDTFDIMRSKKIFVWSVGIDTDEFMPNKNAKRDCLIYFKSRELNELNFLTHELRTNNISFDILKYGSYDEKEFKAKINEAKIVILLTNTESQGIAYMEVLSMDTPCYVINKNVWNAHESTSTPYFNEACGMIVDSFDMASFSIFFNKTYKPREFILNEHTLEISAKKYVKILEESHK